MAAEIVTGEDVQDEGSSLDEDFLHDDDVIDAILAILRERPHRFDALVDQLIERLDGLLEQFGDRAGVEEFVSELHPQIVGIWSTPAGALGSVAWALEGTTASLGLDQDDLDAGTVTSRFDDGVLSEIFSLGDEVDVSGYKRTFVTEVSSYGHTAVSGADGWLAGATTDDVVVFHFDDERLSHSIVAGSDLGNGEREAELLAKCLDDIRARGVGQDDLSIMLDVLVDSGIEEPRPWSAPVPPLRELLLAAGFENRGSEWGPAGEIWSTTLELARRQRDRELADAYGFGPCCDVAFEAVLAALELIRLERVDGGARSDLVELFTDERLEAVGSAVSHMLVGSVLAARYLPLHPSLGSDFEDLGWLLRAEHLSASARAAGAFVGAVEAERAGRGTEAARSAAQAVRLAPSFQPARELAGLYEVDRGELSKALRLTTDPEFPDEGPARSIRLARADMEATFAGVRRNDSCPCGSGKRFKQCCQRHPKLPPFQRLRLLDFRLFMFSERPHRNSEAMALEEREVRLDPLGMLDGRDALVVSGNLLRDYLAERGELLPDSDRALAEAALDAGFSVVQVVEVFDPPTRGRVQLLPDGPINDFEASNGALGEGSVLLGRFLNVDGTFTYAGSLVRLDEGQVDEALAGLAEEKDAVRFLDWLAELTGRREILRDGKPLILSQTMLSLSDAERQAPLVEQELAQTHTYSGVAWNRNGAETESSFVLVTEKIVSIVEVDEHYRLDIVERINRVAGAAGEVQEVYKNETPVTMEELRARQRIEDEAAADLEDVWDDDDSAFDSGVGSKRPDGKGPDGGVGGLQLP